MPGFLRSGGTMGQLIAQFDWQQTSLGAIDCWPETLKTAVSLILNSHHPMWIGWGPDHLFLYNDPYIEVLSQAKHPGALGRPAAKIWDEIWDICGPLADQVYHQGVSSYVDNVQLLMRRQNYIEETFYSFSYSPICNSDGEVVGLFCPSTEITEKVLNQRRLKTLSELAAKALTDQSVQSTCSSSAAVLAQNSADMPFALLYLIERSKEQAVLQEAVGLDLLDSPFSPLKVDYTAASPADSEVLWPIADVARTGVAREMDIPPHLTVPLGPTGHKTCKAMILPVVSTGQTAPVGILVAGINPCRLLDLPYRTFFSLVATQIATAIDRAYASEQKKERLEALAAIDQAKSTFFSNVSHELRTPLTLMLSPIEDLLEGLCGPLTEQQDQHVRLVRRNAQRLLKLVNSLLDFSRIEAGKMQAHRQHTDLSKLTRELAHMFQSATYRAKIKLNIHVEDIEARGPVFVDRDMWEKIVFNLVSNAFKFTLQGEINLRLKADAECAILTVQDTGIGIAAADVPKLFTRFYRVEGAQGRTHEGTGIGLALVQELTHLHGGSLSVESTVGVGSTFTVKIPLKPSHLPASDGKSKTHATPLSQHSSALGAAFVDEAIQWLPPQKSTGTDTKRPILQGHTPLAHLQALKDDVRIPGKILLADDNVDMRHYIQELLQPYREVCSVTQGFEALEVAKTQDIALVLSDVMMPQMNGFELLKALRNNPKTQSLPIILMSARAGEESKTEGLSAGADDYLVKPFSAKELLARVNAHLELSRLRVENAAERQRVQEVLMQAPVPICVLEGPDLVFTLANNAFSQLIGSHRDVIDKPIAQAIPEIEKRGYLDEIRKVYATGKPYTGREVRVKQFGHKALSDGSSDAMFVDFVYQPKINAQKEVEGVVVVITDVTIQVLARQKIERAEERSKFALEASQMGEWALDFEKGTTYHSLRHDQCFGHTTLLKEWSYDHFLERIHPDDRGKIGQQVQEVKKHHDQLSFECRIIWPDTSIHWISVRGHVKRNAAQKPLQMAGLVWDITERKKVERDLIEAISIRDDLMSIASHELKTPLTSLRLQTQSMRRNYNKGHTQSFSPEKVGRLIDNNERQINRLVRLVDDMLDLSRIQSGSLSLSPEQFNLCDTVYEVAERLSEQFDNAHCEVVLRCKDPARVWLDRYRIEQVVTNLFTNALRYGRGGIIEVTVARLDNGTVRMSVRDEGIGIAQENQNRIFERFERAASPNEISGLGLGLYITRQIIEPQNGRIWVESTLGQGATFWVDFFGSTTQELTETSTLSDNALPASKARSHHSTS